MTGCRACGDPRLVRVLDLGTVPAADHFPVAQSPVAPDEASHALAMDLCLGCGLAQLADDDTVADEPRGVEPQALKDQARDAIDTVAANGWLAGNTVVEFGSPHGGTWVPLLTARGFRALEPAGAEPADVVLDCFGIMHEPDQRAAFARRAELTAPDGVLLLQYHSIATILRQGQWNALRHGHFAYYSLTALIPLLAAAGLHVHRVWDFDLYGGTQLIAATRRPARPGDTVRATLAAEADMGIAGPDAYTALQSAADTQVADLRRWLVAETGCGKTVYAYGAASRAVAMFSRAGLDSRLLAGVADASAAKQGRRMPGTDIAIVSPQDMAARDPDLVYLTVPDLLAEVSVRYPQLAGRWRLEAGAPQTLGVSTA